IIDRQVEQLNRLVDDMLDLSRISRGLIELKTESLPIRDFILPAVETCQPLIDARRQKFRLMLPPDDVWVEGDRIRLTQVVSNLINNASKFTQEGGHIGLTAEPSDDSVCIRVYDSGCGIDPTELSNVFDLFYQANRSLDRSRGGLGIGLSLVHNLVAKHGGKVLAFSEGLGKGSEFVVRLPQRDHPSSTSVSTASGPKPTWRKLRILVVDDNLDVAESLSLLLKTEGFKVWTAYDGPTAVEMVRVEHPDVVLLDIGLPGMDGYSVAQEIRRRRELGQPLLIAVTGYGRTEDREKSKAAGFDEHLIKPVDIDTLRKCLLDHHQLLVAVGPQNV
ncbi:MAG: ATP-binding protein, partial [Methylococcaceae bacterium]|nr:ATP-binding protein [Methylococcaceae bacterium]